jgi:hypothetical protein
LTVIARIISAITRPHFRPALLSTAAGRYNPRQPEIAPPGAAQRVSGGTLRSEIKSEIPEDFDGEISRSDLLARLPGLQRNNYGRRTAQDALKNLVPEVLTREEKGRCKCPTE